MNFLPSTSVHMGAKELAYAKVLTLFLGVPLMFSLTAPLSPRQKPLGRQLPHVVLRSELSRSVALLHEGCHPSTLTGRLSFSLVGLTCLEGVPRFTMPSRYKLHVSSSKRYHF